MDNAARNAIESPFGVAKRRYGLDRIMAKLDCTSCTVIALQFLILNLDARVRLLLRCFYAMLNVFRMAAQERPSVTACC